jgi:AraC family transcriptional regulator
MQLYRFAYLGKPPSYLMTTRGDLAQDRLEWLQPPDAWSVIYYQHGNALSIDGRVFTVEPDTIVLFPPGCRCTSGRIGDGTGHIFASFNLPADYGKRWAMPLINPGMSPLLDPFTAAHERVATCLEHCASFVWHLMFCLATDPSAVRERPELYTAEDWILRNLHRRFSVPELADAVGVSQRTLLTAFRQEHHTSIQEFVRQKRVQEAARLLSSTQMPIKEIAVRVGIPDLQAFNKIIRLETGSSPRQFRALGMIR